MSADAGGGRQLTFDDSDIWHEFPDTVIHDDRVLEPIETCAHCPADAIQDGLCVRHLNEYRKDLCGDGVL